MRIIFVCLRFDVDKIHFIGLLFINKHFSASFVSNIIAYCSICLGFDSRLCRGIFSCEELLHGHILGLYRLSKFCLVFYQEEVPLFCWPQVRGGVPIVRIPICGSYKIKYRTYEEVLGFYSRLCFGIFSSGVFSMVCTNWVFLCFFVCALCPCSSLCCLRRRLLLSPYYRSREAFQVSVFLYMVHRI